MDNNVHLQGVSAETFFSEEVVASLLSLSGHNWRQPMSYDDLPLHLRTVSECITRVVTGVNIFSGQYNQIIEQQFESISSTLEQTPKQQRSDRVFECLIDAAQEMVTIDDEARTIFAFIALVTKVCRLFLGTDQTILISKACSAIPPVLSTEVPEGFLSNVEKLIDFIDKFNN